MRAERSLQHVQQRVERGSRAGHDGRFGGVFDADVPGIVPERDGAGDEDDDVVFPRATSEDVLASRHVDFSRAIFRQLSDRLRGHRATQRGAFEGGEDGGCSRARVAGGVRDEAVSVGVDCPARRGVVECSESVAARGVVVQVAILAPLAPASDRLAQATWVVREVEDLEGDALEGFHLLVVEDLDVADALAGEEEPAEGGGGGVAQPHPRGVHHEERAGRHQPGVHAVRADEERGHKDRAPQRGKPRHGAPEHRC